MVVEKYQKIVPIEEYVDSYLDSYIPDHKSLVWYQLFINTKMDITTKPNPNGSGFVHEWRYEL